MKSDLEETVFGVQCVRWNPERTLEDGTSARVSNFGDLLGPMIAERIVERYSGRRDPSRTRRVLSVGSVIHFARPADVVWGSGVNGKLGVQRIPPSLDVRAVRGPYTRAVLAGRGIDAPPLYGDPVLLLAELWPELSDPTATKRHSMLAVPNLNEPERFDPDITRSPVGDPWAVIADIAASEFVTGTSLHALVVADALGIPNRPIIPDVESPFKYLDYYTGTGRSDVRFARTVEDALALGPVDPPQFDAAGLLAAFPIDVWTGAPAPVTATTIDFRGLRAASAAQQHDLRTLAGPEPAPEAATSLGRLEMLANRDPSIDGLTRDELTLIGSSSDRSTDPASPEPVLSVIIPTHNVRPWVGETIASILAQDLDGLEVLVIDDHSTDDTRAALDEFAASDARIRVIDAVTRGGGTARNIGIDHARGRYLAFCDGDDLVPPGAYRALVESLEASGSEIAFGDYLKFSPTRSWRPTENWPAYQSPRRGIRVVDEPSIIFGRPCWNKVFRRSFWDRIDIRFPDVPRSNDIVPMMTAYLRAPRVDVIDDVVYLYRERPGASSMTAKASSATALISYLDQEIECAQLVRDVDSAGLRRAYSSLILDRDGWVHISKYLRSEQRDPAREPEIRAKVARLVELTGTSPRRMRAPQKRAVFELVLQGSMELAAAVATLFSGTEAALHHRLAAWVRVLHGRSEDGVDLLARHPFFASQLMIILSEAVRRGGHADDLPLVDLARAIPVEEEVRRRAIPELAAATREPLERLAERFAETRSAAAIFTRLETGRSIRFTITGTDAEHRLEPVLYDEASGAVYRARSTREVAGDEVVWHGRVPASAVPKYAPLRPALCRRGSNDVVSVGFRAQTPEYDRFDRFLLHFDERGVQISRRSNWVRRAAGSAVRAARRRLRPQPAAA